MTLHVSRIPSLLSFFFFFPPFPSPSSNVRYSSRSRGRQRSYFSPGRPFSRWNLREINVKFQSRRCVETWHLLNDYLHWTQKTLFILDTSNVSEGREALRKWWWPGRDALKPDARFYVSRFHARNNAWYIREKNFSTFQVTSRPEEAFSFSAKLPWPT